MIEIHHANCLQWLREQRADSIGGVVMDPPYYLQGSDNLTTFLNDVVGECLRVSKGPVYYIAPLVWEFDPPMSQRRHPPFKLPPDHAGMWCTRNASMRAVAPVLCWKGHDPGSFEIQLPDEALKGERSTLKPLGLFTRLVRLIPKGTVLDPFMGYGTCGEACQMLGRDFIGIENNAGVFEEARKRLLPNASHGEDWAKER